jgi:hypothetical protein
MNRSREWFQAVAQETGYRVETLEKVLRPGELAAEIGRHPLLGRVLALKGGTALNLAFGPPSRLSVDLDFNYVGAEEREGMLEQRPDVERSVDAVARAGGYQLQWSRAEHAGRKAWAPWGHMTSFSAWIESGLAQADPPLHSKAELGLCDMLEEAV